MQIPKTSSAIYFIKLKKPVLGFAKGKIVYIGKGKNAKKRLEQELGIRKGSATFFRSIGVLRKGKVIPGSGKNFRFYDHDRIKKWLSDYAIGEITDYGVLEEKGLIQKHKPLLNIVHNAENCYGGLRELRAKAKRVAIKKRRA